MSAEGLTRVLVLAVLLALLEGLCRGGAISPLVFVAPSTMVTELAHIIADGDIAGPLARTATNVVIAFVGSVILGIGLAVLVHRYSRLRAALDPFLASYQSVPIFVFYPLLISIFGITPIALILLALALGVPTMMLSSLSGLDRVRPVLRKMSRVMKLSPLAEVRHITLPAILPDVFGGLKLAFAYVFTGVLAGEFIMSEGGLGFAISDAYESFRNARMYALMLFVITIGMVITLTLHGWEARVAGRRGRL